MYYNLQVLEAHKNAINKLQKEICRLNRFSPATVSGAKKRQAIPIYQNEIAHHTKEFNEIVPSVIAWTETFEFERREYAQIICYHYCDINRLPHQLQQSITDCGSTLTASNFRSDIIKMWLRDLSKEIS